MPFIIAFTQKWFNKKHFSNTENIQHIEQSLYGVTHFTVEVRCYQWCYRVVLQTEVWLWAIHIGIFLYKCILLLHFIENWFIKNIFTTQKLFNTLNKVCMVLHTLLLKPGVTGVTRGYQCCYRVVLQTEVWLWAIHIGIFCINAFYYCIYTKKWFNKKHFSNTGNIQHIEQSLYRITHWCYKSSSRFTP